MTTIGSGGKKHEATPSLQLPFLGLLAVDSAAMTQWHFKVLGNAGGGGGRRRGGPMSPAASLRRFGNASPTATLREGNAPSPTHTNAGSMHRRPMSPVGSMAGDCSSVGGDDDAPTHEPITMNASRVRHLHDVQTKLDRAREAHAKAEEKRHAIHNAAKVATRNVRVGSVQDLEHLDKSNYLHPLSDKRADLTRRIQRHKQRGFTDYLSKSMFSGL